jgi:hypothetical protein
MVEGYATDDTRDGQYLLSRQRARLVRDYIAGRFGIDPRNMGVMPMGSEAPNSPGGASWDGVALALFVPKEAFTAVKPVAQGLIDRN